MDQNPLPGFDHPALQSALSGLSKHSAKAYRTDWSDFVAYCAAERESPLPATPGSVRAYITQLAHKGRQLTTIRRRIAAIGFVHKHCGHASPTRHASVQHCLRQLEQEYGQPVQRKIPILTTLIEAFDRVLGNDLWSVRDRAMILIGFAGGLRRSELVSLTTDDCTLTGEGLILNLYRGSEANRSEGRRIGIPFGKRAHTCPVRALDRWMTQADIHSGPIFRPIRNNGKVVPKPLNDRSVALMIKRRAAEAGLDPALFSGHSMRAGLVTQALINGAPDHKVMAQTGHTSTLALRPYIREIELFRENAALFLGL